MFNCTREKRRLHFCNVKLVHVPMHSSAIQTILTAFALTSQLCQGCGQGSREVGNCLHTFLERDFQSIEAIVFPDKNKYHEKDKLLLDGPELESTCNRIGEVVLCLEELQHTCYYYRDFFPFRSLVSSLRKAIDWTCSDLRGRFRTLLMDFYCIETVRLNATRAQHICYDDQIKSNVWQMIIRMEMGSVDTCPRIIAQHDCLVRRGYFRSCDNRTTAVYNDLLGIFTSKWCSRNRASTAVYSDFISISYAFTVTFVTFLLSQA